MRDRLLHHYERELRFLRRMAGEFAEAHPDVAAGLQLDPTRCDDPHVERLIEACAMLAARVQLRLDDDFSEVSQALLGMLYPHYLAPVPSMAMVQFEVDPENGAVAGGVKVPRHTLLHAPSVHHVRPRFRTAYALALWPLEVSGVELVPSNRLGAAVPRDVRSAVRVTLRAPEGVRIDALGIDRLRFFLPGDGGAVPPLYELIFRNPRGLLIQCGRHTRTLPPEHVRPVGFEPEEGLLEYPRASGLAYRLLQEYFAFAEKFQFVELSGIDLLPRDPDGGNELTLSVLLEDSAALHDLKLGADDMRLGCTPAVNLFTHMAEPIRLTRTQSEYEVVPDVRSPGGYEVYAIRRVTGVRPGSATVREFHPFYALRHGESERRGGAYWHSSRRAPLRKGRTASQVFLSLVDPDFQVHQPSVDTLTVETLCTNADLPPRLELGSGESGASRAPRRDFQIEGLSQIRSVRCLRSPSESLPAPVGEGSRWRIISHLAVNYLSISGDGDTPGGLEALRELLVLYDFADSALTRNRIHGLVGLESKRVVRRMGRGAAAGFIRGLEVGLEFDPHGYTGGGILLFAAVLERFLGLHAAVHSFTQVSASVRGREGNLKRWPPRSGRAIVL